MTELRSTKGKQEHPGTKPSRMSRHGDIRFILGFTGETHPGSVCAHEFLSQTSLFDHRFMSTLQYFSTWEVEILMEAYEEEKEQIKNKGNPSTVIKQGEQGGQSLPDLLNV